MSNPVFWEKYEKIFQYVVCWKFYPECWVLRAETDMSEQIVYLEQIQGLVLFAMVLLYQSQKLLYTNNFKVILVKYSFLR